MSPTLDSQLLYVFDSTSEDIQAFKSTTLDSQLYTAHPWPYVLQPTPYTLYPAPCTLYPIPYTLQPQTLSHTSQIEEAEDELVDAASALQDGDVEAAWNCCGKARSLFQRAGALSRLGEVDAVEAQVRKASVCTLRLNFCGECAHPTGTSHKKGFFPCLEDVVHSLHPALVCASRGVLSLVA